ncbi:MAG: hypothetical protein EA421_13445 [Gemmatimonadales bacterium]|nr:MAG: hypothetical protein EA421_13445 [Gemmatimonadales bacterium]
MQNGPTVLSLLLVVSTLAACGGWGGRTGPDPFSTGDERSFSIQVENLSSEDMRVAVLGPDRRHDLGQINPRSTGRFAIPLSEHAQVRIRIEPISGSPHTMPAMTVEPGDHLELFLQFPASRSMLRR